jgi:hypothetical protein
MVEVTTASPKYLGANGLRRVPAEARSRWAVVSPPPSAVGIRQLSQHSARSGGCGPVAGDGHQNVVTL